MSTPAPQTIAADLFGQMERHFDAGTTPEPLELKRIERGARQLAAVDALDAQQVLAMLSALRWDVEGVHTHLRNALNIGPRYHTFANASIITGQINDFEASAEHARHAWEMARQDPDASRQYITALLRTGRVRLVAELAPTMNISDEERDSARLDEIVKALDELGITDERIGAEMRVTFDAMRERKMRAPAARFRCEYDPEDGQPSVVYCIAMHGDAEDEEVLAAAIVTQLKDMPGWNPSAFLIDLVHATNFKHELQLA